MSEEKKEKKKKKSRSYHDDDDVQADVRAAMKDVARALSDVRMATKETRKAKKTVKKSEKDAKIARHSAEISQEATYQEEQKFAMTTQPGGKTGGGPPDGADNLGNGGTQQGNKPGNYYYTQNVTSQQQYNVFINKAQNIQVGPQNTMYVVNDTKSRHRAESSSSDSEEEESTQQRNQSNIDPDQDPSNLTEEERKIWDVLRSERLAVPADFSVICSYLGQDWTRFFRFLDMTDPEIYETREEFQLRGGQREVNFQLLTLWRRKAGNDAYIGTLAKALNRIGQLETIKALKP